MGVVTVLSPGSQEFIAGGPGLHAWALWGETGTSCSALGATVPDPVECGSELGLHPSDEGRAAFGRTLGLN
eukprot:6643700-Pyramimonas_sp.AAC.1